MNHAHRLTKAIDHLIAHPAPSLLGHLGNKPISRTEALGAWRQLEVYLASHVPPRMTDDEYMEILTSLVLARRGRDIARLMTRGGLHTDWQADTEWRQRQSTWDDGVLASLAPLHRLTTTIRRAWDERPL